MSVLIKMREYHNLSETELVVKNYILKNTKDFLNESVRDIAKKTFTSPSTVVRFCQRIEPEGLIQLKLKLAAEIDSYANLDLDSLKSNIIEENDSFLDVVDKITSISIQSIEETRLLLDEKSIKDAAAQEIAHAIDAITNTLSNGGRLVYIGAGTSGRLGVLDASEILPTFGVGEEMVIGIIAGGDTALRNPIENAEDSLELAVEDLKKIGFNKNDILCAIASSGRTPYCIGGVNYARDLGAQSVSISCSSNSALSKIVDYPIELIVGQEVIMGSTRLKSGTATKMVLNMLSTGTMINLGKVYGNLMVDLKASNQKLIERSKDIIMKATNCTYERASELLELSKLNVKQAIIMELMSVDLITAIELLKNNDGRISSIVNP